MNRYELGTVAAMIGAIIGLVLIGLLTVFEISLASRGYIAIFVLAMLTLTFIVSLIAVVQGK